MKRLNKIVLLILAAQLAFACCVSADDLSGQEQVAGILRTDFGIEESDEVLYQFIDYYHLTMDNIYNSNISYLYKNFRYDSQQVSESASFIDESQSSEGFDSGSLIKFEYTENANDKVYYFACDFENHTEYTGLSESVVNIGVGAPLLIDEAEADELLAGLTSFQIESWEDEYVSSYNATSTGWFSWSVLMEDAQHHVIKKSGWGVTSDNQPANFAEFQKYIWERLAD